MIAAVIVTFKDGEATHRCVTSLLAARPAPALILMVDNGSPNNAGDHHESWVQGIGIPWRVVREARAIAEGVSAGLFRGATERTAARRWSGSEPPTRGP